MLVGVGLPNTIEGVTGKALLEWARRADTGSFSSVAVLDRVAYDSHDPLATLAAAAAITSRVRLATMIVIGPLHNNTLLAKTASTINSLSNGRFTLGLSVGARRDDYDATGIPYHERGARLDRQITEIRNQWEAGKIGPHSTPSLLLGGLVDATFSRVARFSDGYMHNGGPPRIFARMADRARAAWSDSGRPGKPQLWGMGYFALGDDTIKKAGADYLLDYYAFTGPFAERIAQGLLTTPQAIVQFMRGYADAGCDQLILFPTSPDLQQFDRLAEIVG